MATVNFSVPDNVKDAFNEAFAGQNKSAIIATLMRRAIEEQELQRRRAGAIRRLGGRRAMRPTATGTTVRRVREAGRA
jgi:hypothetical protein